MWVGLQICTFGPLFSCGDRRGSIHLSWVNKAQKDTGLPESSWKPVSKSKFSTGLEYLPSTSAIVLSFLSFPIADT